jgi:hypothetical protein
MRLSDIEIEHLLGINEALETGISNPERVNNTINRPV